MTDFSVDINWSTPISNDEPAGKNFEFENKFAELETAAISSPEQQYGNTVIPAKDPDWQQVLSLATEISKETKDIRVIFLLTRALTKIYGLEGLSYGLHSLRIICTEFWKDFYPKLDIDEYFDPHIRFGVLSNFGDVATIAADMRNSILLSSHIGDISVKDIEKIIDNSSVDINGIPVTKTQIIQIIKEQNDYENRNIFQTPSKILEELEIIKNICIKELGHEFEPNFKKIKNPLEKILTLIKNNEEIKPELNLITNDIQNRSETVFIENVRSRKDAIRQLELACKYLEDHEPTNPAPLLIKRAIKVMDMKFIDIVRNMAPDGLNQAIFITGEEE